MRFEWKRILDKADSRPPGYVEDVLSHGKLDGEWIEFDDEAYRKLMEKYRGDAGGCKGCGA